ncbi:hypothetical protein DsansV1_C05g0052191 [Dioscorea sansibarensis]
MKITLSTKKIPRHGNLHNLEHLNANGLPNSDGIKRAFIIEAKNKELPINCEKEGYLRVDGSIKCFTRTSSTFFARKCVSFYSSKLG